MARRRKRLDKKLHTRFIEDVLLFAITNPAWRQDFLGLEAGSSLTLDARLAAGRMDEASFLLRRFGLRYTLERAEDDWAPDPEPLEDTLKFRLQAAAHTSVCLYVEEFSDEIGADA